MHRSLRVKSRDINFTFKFRREIELVCMNREVKSRDENYSSKFIVESEIVYRAHDRSRNINFPAECSWKLSDGGTG